MITLLGCKPKLYEIIPVGCRLIRRRLCFDVRMDA